MMINYASSLKKHPKPETLSERLAVQFSPQQPRVLVVDSSTEFRQHLCEALQERGLTTEAVSNGVEALQLLTDVDSSDLIVLELHPTSTQRFQIAEQIKMWGETPIIFTAATKDVETVVAALNRYAEDYVVKPCHIAELTVRIQRVLLRTGPLHQRDREYAVDGRLRINFAQQYAIADDAQVMLTPTESRILHVLYEHRGRVLAPDYLLTNAWDSTRGGTLESLWVHMRRLRSKIEPDPDNPTYVVTVRGRGYCLPETTKPRVRMV
jgi:DNA-binding response OmpR family regulator